MQPSKLIVISSKHRINNDDKHTNFTVDLGDNNNFVANGGNFYCRLVDLLVESDSTPGIPEKMTGFCGIESNLSHSEVCVSTNHDVTPPTKSNATNIIGFCTLQNNRQYLGDFALAMERNFGVNTIRFNDVYTKISAPRGVCSFKLIGTDGDVFKEAYTNPEVQGDTGAIAAFTETINEITIVLEVKQISPIKELKGEILARRPMQS